MGDIDLRNKHNTFLFDFLETKLIKLCPKLTKLVQRKIKAAACFNLVNTYYYIEYATRKNMEYRIRIKSNL